MTYKYEEIIDQLDEEKIKKFLTNLKIPFIEKDNSLILPTVCHNCDVETASNKLYYYKDTHLFYCYTECGGMNIFRFLENYYKTRDIDYNWFTDIYEKIRLNNGINLEFVENKYESIRDRFQKDKKDIVLPEFDPNVLDVFTKMYPREWINDRITKKTMDKYNILYSISQHKIIIPHYDVNDRLIGIRGRALSEWEVKNIGKYLPVKVEQTWYSHPLSLNLYGLNKNKENIKQNGYVYIVESEKSVLQLEGYYEENCSVAVCGSSLNKFQLDILMRECQPKEIIICFDKEEEKEENDKYFNKLYLMCSKYKNYSNFSFLYDFDKVLNLKDSPTDKGKGVFEYLLKKGRINVK